MPGDKPRGRKTRYIEPSDRKLRSRGLSADSSDSFEDASQYLEQPKADRKYSAAEECAAANQVIESINSSLSSAESTLEDLKQLSPKWDRLAAELDNITKDHSKGEKISKGQVGKVKTFFENLSRSNSAENIMSGKQETTFQGEGQGAEGGLISKSNSLESLESEKDTRNLAYFPTEDVELNGHLQILTEKTAEHAKKVVRDLHNKEMQAKNEAIQEALHLELLKKQQREDEEQEREAELYLLGKQQASITAVQGWPGLDELSEAQVMSTSSGTVFKSSYANKLHLSTQQQLGTDLSNNKQSDSSRTAPNGPHLENPLKGLSNLELGNQASAPQRGSQAASHRGPGVQWQLFKHRMNNQTVQCAEDIQMLSNALEGNLDSRKLKNTLKETRRNIEDLQRALKQAEDLALRVYCPDLQEVYNVIRANIRHFVDIETAVEELLEALNPKAKQDPPESVLGTLAKNIWGVAQAKPVELPTFDGTSASAYANFKSKFQYVIQQCNIPRELWATHLEDNLIGKAKDYVGKNGTWHNNWPGLWNYLDQKYANRWNLASEAVSNFFFKPSPSGDKRDTANYIYQQKNNLDQILALGLTIEEIGVNTILQNLPEEHAKEIRQALRTAHAGKSEKEHFKMKTLIQVTNDTIGIENASRTPDLTVAKSTLNLATQQTQVPTSRFSRGRYRGARGGNRGRGGKTTSSGLWECSVCPENTKKGHNQYTCTLYKTPDEKRKQLVAQGRCPICIAHMPVSEPHKCYPPPCPNEGCSEKHVKYLCDKYVPIGSKNYKYKNSSKP